MASKKLHPLPCIDGFLREHRRGRLLPLAGNCRECGPGYLPGHHFAAGILWPVLGEARCPKCGTWQALRGLYQECLNGRCKAVLHWHLGSRALQGAVLLRAIRG